jgi:hypothetical protein
VIMQICLAALSSSMAGEAAIGHSPRDLGQKHDRQPPLITRL